MMNPSDIREHMKVVGSDMQPVGTVDHVEGDRIKLARNDPQAQGQHHYIPTAWVERKLDDDRICLRQSAQEACSQWQSA